MLLLTVQVGGVRIGGGGAKESVDPGPTSPLLVVGGREELLPSSSLREKVPAAGDWLLIPCHCVFRKQEKEEAKLKRVKEKNRPEQRIYCKSRVSLLWGHKIPDNDFNNRRWMAQEVGGRGPRSRMAGSRK